MPDLERTKGALRSRAVWGAILTLVSAFGLLPFSASFDPETGVVSFNAYDVMTMLGAAALPAGGLLSWIGRVGARSAIRGLW